MLFARLVKVMKSACERPCAKDVGHGWRVKSMELFTCVPLLLDYIGSSSGMRFGVSGKMRFNDGNDGRVQVINESVGDRNGVNGLLCQICA